MALDTGRFPDEYRDDGGRSMSGLLDDAPSLGAGLRAARIAAGRSLLEMSVVTKVHSRYLKALEEGDFSALPTRVFAIGYVRAYAGALDLDEQSAVERFKLESPDMTAPLQPPVGAAFQDVGRRSQPVLIVLAVVLVAVVVWNVFQRVSLRNAPRPSDLASVPATWTQAGKGAVDPPLNLTAARRAPPDQTTPVLYVTPGLEGELTVGQTAQLVAEAAAASPVQAAFNPRGAVYGEAATASQVIIQARKPASIVVRMADGRVLFARQLASGEAWRAPLNVSATVDLSDPKVFDVYYNGEFGGALTDILTPLQTLNSRAASLAAEVAAQAAARQEAEQLVLQQRARQELARQQALQTARPPFTPSSPPAPAANRPG